ncbi:MAG: aquaporin [Clostridiales bacterium]|jgi:aquaporin Z|nr:aquaporin [Clostridiales bacterium]
MNLSKQFCAEFFGTAVLVLFAVGSAISGAGVVGTAIAFGLVIVVMSFIIGPISGCHINPAISIAALINRKLNFKQFICFVAAQFLGALLGGLILFTIFKLLDGDNFNGHNLGQNYYSIQHTGHGISKSQMILFGLIVEFVLSFVFVFSFAALTSNSQYVKSKVGNFAGVLVGVTLTLVHLFGIGLTGTSVNPARSYGVAVFDREAIQEVWVFLLAPTVAAIVAGLLAKFLFKEKPIDKTVDNEQIPLTKIEEI